MVIQIIRSEIIVFYTNLVFALILLFLLILQISYLVIVYHYGMTYQLTVKISASNQKKKIGRAHV